MLFFILLFFMIFFLFDCYKGSHKKYFDLIEITDLIFFFQILFFILLVYFRSFSFFFSFLVVVKAVTKKFCHQIDGYAGSVNRLNVLVFSTAINSSMCATQRLLCYPRNTVLTRIRATQ
jgi:hypothetical protein